MYKSSGVLRGFVLESILWIAFRTLLSHAWTDSIHSLVGPPNSRALNKRRGIPPYRPYAKDSRCNSWLDPELFHMLGNPQKQLNNCIYSTGSRGSRSPNKELRRLPPSAMSKRRASLVMQTICIASLGLRTTQIRRLSCRTSDTPVDGASKAGRR